MSITVNTNLPSLASQRQAENSTNSIRKDFERLASGKRINSASDDAAGLAIALDLLSDAGTRGVASRNISDGVSLASIADSALASTTDITTRMSELATQAANGTLSGSQRQALNNEYQELSRELDRIAQTTTFNDQQLLSGNSSFSLQAGVDGQKTSQINLSLPGVSSSSLGLTSDLLSQESARAAIEEVDLAIDSLTSSRGEIGATVSRLETAFENIKTAELGERDAASRIQDADVAQESSNLVADRIRQQISTAIQGQANGAPAIAMKLLG
jgi:flagellin